MEPWCGDTMGKHTSSVEPCIGSKIHELFMYLCLSYQGNISLAWLQFTVVFGWWIQYILTGA
jgi:hypothetical protein